MRTSFLRRTYRVPRTMEDELVAALWADGTLGVEVYPEADQLRLEAWFDPPPPVACAPERLVGETEIPAADWLAAYRRRAQPFPVGRRFVVDPREPGETVAPSSERLGLRLPARTAFGTGSHPSTRLALELVEDAFTATPPPARVLDLGTGTGILAFVALALGARRVLALDVDPAAAVQAASNATLNAGVLAGRRPRLCVGSIDVLEPGARFDLVVANVLPERLGDALEGLGERLDPGGELILSGLLVEIGAEVLSRLPALEPAAGRDDGEWIAYRLRRPR